MTSIALLREIVTDLANERLPTDGCDTADETDAALDAWTAADEHRMWQRFKWFIERSRRLVGHRDTRSGSKVKL